MFRINRPMCAAAAFGALLLAAPATASIDLRVANVQVLSIVDGTAQVRADIQLDFAEFDVDFPLTIGIYDGDSVLRAIVDRNIEPTQCGVGTCTTCSVLVSGTPVAGRCYGLLTPPGCACFVSMSLDLTVTGVGPTGGDERWRVVVDHGNVLPEREELNNSYSFVMAVPCIQSLPGIFTADRFSAVPLDRMQVVAHYDGNGTAEMDLHLVNPSTQDCCIITISNISSNPLTTDEYVLNGYVPTGRVDIRNVVPNGAIDGVAFGLYWRDATGKRWRTQSRDLNYVGSPNFMGGWPVAWSEATWDSLMPALSGGGTTGLVQRRQAQMILSGAQMLGNGTHGIPTRRVPGDIDGDGCVDLSDLSLLLSAFGACCP